jgi:hypothetical protein
MEFLKGVPKLKNVPASIYLQFSISVLAKLKTGYSPKKTCPPELCGVKHKYGLLNCTKSIDREFYRIRY